MKLYFVIQQRKTFNKGKKDKRSYGLALTRSEMFKLISVFHFPFSQRRISSAGTLANDIILLIVDVHYDSHLTFQFEY